MQPDEPTTAALLTSWRNYAARQPDSVGALLTLLRDRLDETEAQQRDAYGADEGQFSRLGSFPRPRPERVPDDAYRIALACGLGRPLAFVSAMLVAGGLSDAAASGLTAAAYRAAYDAPDDAGELDDPDELLDE